MNGRVLLIPAGCKLHPARNNYTGASEVGAAGGVGQFKTPFELYMEKIGQRHVIQTPIMLRGTFGQSMVLNYVMHELGGGFRFIVPNVMIVNDEHGIEVTPDALAEEVDEPGLINVELKLIGLSRLNSWGDEPPLDYQLQVITGNWLLDSRYGLLCALGISERDAQLRIFPIARHPAAEAKVCEIGRDFRKRILERRPPAVDYERDAEIIAKVRAEPELPTLDLTGDNRLAELLPARALLKARQSGLEAEIRKMDTEIKDKLGAAQRASLPGWNLSWVEEIIEEHTVPTFTRRPLRISEEKAV